MRATRAACNVVKAGHVLVEREGPSGHGETHLDLRMHKLCVFWANLFGVFGEQCLKFEIL